jgi:hypothetical protein
MKDTGKTIHGVKVYSDPEAPPDTLFMVNGDFKNEQPPRNNGTFTAVTQSEKLEALVKRAIEDSWKPVEKEFEWRVIDTYPAPFLSIMIAIVDTSAFDTTNVIEKKLTVNDILFNHDFLKALFGDMPMHTFGIGRDTKSFDGEVTEYDWELEETFTISNWQHQGQQAVIAPNPVDYMYDEVFGK